MYTPFQHAIGNPATCSHDVYALAATMHKVLFERQPFWYGGEKHQEKGLDWSELNRDAWQWIPEFLDKATASNIDDRFTNAMQAIKWTKQKTA